MGTTTLICGNILWGNIPATKLRSSLGQSQTSARRIAIVPTQQAKADSSAFAAE
jgi:hypothetical protein